MAEKTDEIRTSRVIGDCELHPSPLKQAHEINCLKMRLDHVIDHMKSRDPEFRDFFDGAANV